MLERPERAAWQKVDELVASLALAPGARVADVGSGSGYFVAALSRAVGPSGRVIAEDIDPELVDRLRMRIEREAWGNVEARLGDPDDPHLGTADLDLVLMVDTYHHIARPEAFLPNVLRALRPGGRLVIVDFAPGDQVPTNIAARGHRIPLEQVTRDGRAAGFELAVERLWPPYQFIVELQRP